MKISIKKSLATILAASVLLPVVSCQKEDYSGKILTTADFISEYAVERKYVEITNMSTGIDSELREFMSMSTDSATIYRPQLAIESTLEYKVLKDTLECYEDDNTGSIDVEFSYCDYEEVLRSTPIFLSIEDFEQAVYDCEERIELTITYQFQYADGFVKLTNISDLNELFPYRDIDVTIAQSFDNYVGAPVFSGPSYNSEYECFNATETLYVEVPVEGDGNLLAWDYYFEIKKGFDVIYTSDVIHDEYPNVLSLEYDNGRYLSGGNYDYTLYDLEGNKICEFSVYVIGNGIINNIAGTSLYYEVPEGFIYGDSNTVDMYERFGNENILVDVFLVNRDVTFTVYHNPGQATEQACINYVNDSYNTIYSNFAEYDVPFSMHIVNYSYSLDGTPINSACYFVDLDGEYYDVYVFTAAFNYEDQTFCVVIYSSNYDTMLTLLDGLHAG
ncbi:MAG: hypothetical protein MJ103_00070 [Saccharofermentans sp.]|nr:hypothetical protein [Saccharofermentans sp.]